MSGKKTLQGLMARGAALLGCPHAIMGGAMSWVSERHLVAALSNVGAFGVIACSSMGPELLEKEIIATRALTSKPFGVNLILMHPQMEALIATCRNQHVSHVVLAGGMPKADQIKAIQAYGAKAIGFAPSLGIARKLVKMGVDALIIEGMEAGGHIGQVSTSVLAQEILPNISEVPVFVAGGIGRGEAIAAFLEMGASGVQLGTRFVCASESVAHQRFKQAFIHAAARDAQPSVQVDPDFPVIPVRAIVNNASEEFTRFQHEVIGKFRRGEMEKKEAQLAIEHFWAGSLRRAVIEGDVDRGSVMAGQSVGMVTSVQPAEAIVQELLAQAAHYLENRSAPALAQA